MSYTIKCDDGDLVTNSSNSYVVIGNVEKCAQDTAESLLNNWDSDLELYYNGSELYLIDDAPAQFATLGMDTFIQSTVEDAVNRLIDLQDEDDYVDEAEKIYEIRDLTVEPIGNLSWYFFLYLVTESDEYVPQSFTINLAQRIPPGLDSSWTSKFEPNRPFTVKPYK